MYLRPIIQSASLNVEANGTSVVLLVSKAVLRLYLSTTQHLLREEHCQKTFLAQDHARLSYARAGPGYQSYS